MIVTPAVKKILNSLLCPLCAAPIDMMPSGIDNSYNYCCASNYDHYKVRINNYDFIPELRAECVSIYDANHKYVIYKLHDGAILTEIWVYETDAENRVHFSFKKKKLLLDFDAFNFTKFNVDKAISRIKTIFVFQ